MNGISDRLRRNFKPGARIKHLNTPKYETTGEKQYTKDYLTDGILQYWAKDVYAANSITISGKMSNDGDNVWSGDIDKSIIQNNTDERISAGFLLGLTNNSTEYDRKVSTEKSQLIITGNKSTTHGGGVLVNGLFVSGDTYDRIIGHSFTLQTSKSVQGLNGEKLSLSESDRFSFAVKDRNGNLVSTGINDSTGSVHFDDRILIDSLVPGTDYAEFYLEENDPESSSILKDDTRYKIQIHVKTDESYIRYQDPETKKLITIHVIKYSVLLGTDGKPQATVYKSENNGKWEQYSDYTFTTDTGNSGGLLTVGNERMPGFVNTKISEREISVTKQWEDNLSQHEDVKVVLKRALVGSNRSNPETVSAVTGEQSGKQEIILGNLNNWSYTWGKLPTSNSEGKDYEYWIEEILTDDQKNLYTVEISDPVSGQYSAPSQGSVEKEVDAWIASTSNNIGNNVVFISDDGHIMTVNGQTLSNKKLNKVTFKDGTTGYLASEIGSDSEFTISEFEYHNYNQNIKSVGFKTLNNNSNWLKVPLNGGTLSISNGAGTADGNAFYIHSSGHLGIQSDGNKWVGFEGNVYTTNYNNGNHIMFYKKQRKTYVESADITNTTYTLNFTVTNRLKTEYSLNIKKVSSDDTSKTLGGAKFQIYKKNQNGGYDLMKFELNDEHYSPSETDGSETLITPISGILDIQKIEKGTYKIVETEAPENYELSAANEYIVELSPENENFDTQSLSLTVTIKNTPKLYELPETGGSGTMLYKAAGSAMILAAISLYGFNRKKRREGED